jgi:Holliday junction resolvase
MVDSREKGARAESVIRDQLRKATGLNWERVPGSGALNEKHGLKGDLYVPNEKNLYCVEVKHYKDDHLTSSVLTGKNPQVIEWWKQAIRQGIQVSKTPLLIFKYDRSKVFAAFTEIPSANYRHMLLHIDEYEFFVALLDDYLSNEKPKFIA